MSPPDVSALLGEWMLKGWILTDSVCPNPSCAVPLMRSPAARSTTIHFCAKCDGGPPGFVVSPPQSVASPALTYTSQISRSSTPPTEFSSSMSSPTFAPIENDETRRRRQQSDAASAEIGSRMLKGWAMLADECPSPRCYGVPLVRPPKAGGEKDARKECVSCNVVYMSEINSNGWERLVPLNASSSSAPAGSSHITSVDKGKGPEETPQAPLSSLPLSSNTAVKSPFTSSLAPSSNLIPTTSYLGALDPSATNALVATTRSLENSLHTLSNHLTTSISQSIIDTASIGVTADAISKVAQALSQVRKLQAIYI